MPYLLNFLFRYNKPVTRQLCINMTDHTDATLEFWKAKFWSQDKSPWHVKDVHHRLLEHRERFLGDVPVRVLVPLCGKSVDLKWLYQAGHEVVGVEGSDKAIREFFDESGLELSVSPYCQNGGQIFQTTDKRLTIICGNFFTVSDPIYLNSFDCVWDRAALVAVEPQHRGKFADSVKRLAKEAFRYLIITTEYDESKVQGPPFSVTKQDIENLYGSWATVEQLDLKTLQPDTKEYINEKFIKANVPLGEGVYYLRNKPSL